MLPHRQGPPGFYSGDRRSAKTRHPCLCGASSFAVSQRIVREIVEGGGDASLCEAGFVEGLSDGQIEALFRTARDADYAAIADEARELSKKHHPRRADEDTRSELETDASRLRKPANTFDWKKMAVPGVA